VRGLGRFYGERLFLGVTPQSLEDLFVLVGRDALLLHAAADRHQKEHRPHGDALGGQQLGQGVDLAEIAAGDGGVDLDGQPQPPGVGEHLHCPPEAAPPAAKGVVRGGVGPVEADAQAAHARGARAGESVGRGQRRGRGRQRNLKPLADGVLDKLKNIRPLERIASGQDQRGPARKRSDLVDQSLRLFGG
jgi:hypothetical protein